MVVGAVCCWIVLALCLLLIRLFTRLVLLLVGWFWMAVGIDLDCDLFVCCGFIVCC